MKKAHFISGIILSIFVTAHLLNHLTAVQSIATHIEVMQVLRRIYQHPLIEPLLLFAVLTQIISGIQLVRNRGWKQREWYNKLHVYSGIYLGFFLLVHTSATLVGRFVLLVDTNFYYGAMVVNLKPYLFFYIPYYFLGAFSFFVHIACIIRIKSIRKIGSQKASRRANWIMGFGALIGIIILWAFTYNVEIPSLYKELMP
jgi:succinate dehydrogenase/fumarate reductase cytochrome b subunit